MAALQKNAISAMPKNTPANDCVKKNTEKPTTLIRPASRTIGVWAPIRSASQPHRLGAATRITCISELSTPMSHAENDSDFRYRLKYGAKVPMKPK